jgi:hypothetical protein
MGEKEFVNRRTTTGAALLDLVGVVLLSMKLSLLVLYYFQYFILNPFMTNKRMFFYFSDTFRPCSCAGSETGTFLGRPFPLFATGTVSVVDVAGEGAIGAGVCGASEVCREERARVVILLIGWAE